MVFKAVVAVVPAFVAVVASVESVVVKYVLLTPYKISLVITLPYGTVKLPLSFVLIENPWQNNLQCPLVSYKDTNINYQGTFEFEFLEKLEQEYGIEWLVNNVSRGPSIWYIDPTDSTKRLYISDFIIDNTIYEIKSGWTWNKHGKDIILEEKNKAKLTACIKEGYNVIVVLNQQRKNYEEIMGRGV